MSIVFAEKLIIPSQEDSECFGFTGRGYSLVL